MTELNVPNAWRKATPVVTDQIRLLLLLSRIRLGAEHQQLAGALCHKIDDWEQFARIAAEHFVAPLCLRHISELPDQARLVEARKALREVVRPMAFQTLRLAALQKSFVREQLARLPGESAVIKGRALAGRYYPDPSLRFSRDLDVLVALDDIPDLIVSAQQAGYSLYPDPTSMSVDEVHVLARQSKVITLIGPERIAIEVHTQLDKAGFLLNHRKMLKRLERVTIDGVTVSTLPTSEHFIYICLHHTKHYWSRLNWLTDLDAMIKAPDFNREAVLALSERLGLARTVAACLGLHDACGAEDPWTEASKSSDVLDLMRACLVILSEGPEKEFEMRPDRLSLDFNFEWQFPPGYQRRSRIEKLKEAFRPSLQDYHVFALPRALYWLYYPLRPALVFARKCGLSS